MSTVLRTELSTSNPYYISKERRCELVHHCLQYQEWRVLYNTCLDAREGFDPVGNAVILRDLYLQRIKTIEEAAAECEPFVSRFVLLAVTESKSYTNLRMTYDIPCCKRTFYSNLHKFFWELDRLLTEKEARYL